MSQALQDDHHDRLVDFLRDAYVALSGQVKQRELTDTEVLLLHKASGLLADFTF